MATLGKIVIPVSSAIKTAYNTTANQGLFDTDEDWLILWVQPGDCRQVNNYTKGEINRGFSSSTVLLKQYYCTLEVKIKEMRSTVYEILKILDDSAIADPTKYELIEIHDYCFLDTATDKSQGYTVRKCVMNIDPPAFMFRGNGVDYIEGLTIVFEQVS